MAMTTTGLIAIIGSALVVGLALAVLILRGTARVNADRRSSQAQPAQDRSALQASMDSFRAAMDSFHTEMQRLAERRSAQHAHRLFQNPDPSRFTGSLLCPPLNSLRAK